MNDRARKLHREAIVVDGHADTIGRSLDNGEDLGTETGKGHLDLPRMIRGGLDAQFIELLAELLAIANPDDVEMEHAIPTRARQLGSEML